MIDVVIIGAGVAGLTCARTLFSHSDKIRVTVLEASNRIGGRIKTITTKDGTTLDLGAQFIHGTVGNPLYDFAVEKELITGDENRDLINSRSVVCFPSEIESLYSHPDKLEEDVLTAESCVADFVERIYKLRDGDIKKLPYNNVGDFMMNLFTSALERSKKNPRFISVLKTVFMKWAHHENIASGCRSVYDLDLRGFLSYVELDGDSLLEMANHCDGGYATIVDGIAADVPSSCIKLNSKVTEVDHASVGGVTKIKVTCTEGDTYYADIAVMTVSVGVLKELLQQNAFAFPLPERKRSAIQKIHLANVVKVFFQFVVPIATDVSFFSFFQPPKFFSTKSAFHSDCPTLERIGSSDWWLLWVISDDEEFQCKDNDVQQYLDDLFDSLSSTYSNFPRNKVDANHIMVVDWKRNENYRGAYTYLRTGTNEEDIAALAEPLFLDGADFLFAGEATSLKFFSTVHGAYESGLREAGNILSKFAI